MNIEELKFNLDGSFRILLFGDICEKDDVDTPDGRARYLDMLRFHRAAIERLKPDFAVYTGDLCVVKDGADGLEEYKNCLIRITEPLRLRGIPFATVMGEREHAAGTEDEQLKILRQLDGCMTDSTPGVSGCTNYCLPVYGKQGVPEFILWFFDSHGLHPNQKLSKYDTVHADQIEWYEKKSAQIMVENDGKSVPGAAFQHIPVIEEYRLMRASKPTELWKSVQGHGRFSNKRYVLRNEDNGYLAEGPRTPEVNCGQFDSWRRTGNVAAAFFGHDHMNNFAGKVDKILLAQCKTSAFRANTDGGRPSVRLVTLREGFSSVDTATYSFKDFGLKCTCLNSAERNLTERQSNNLLKARNAAAAGIAAATIYAGAKKIISLIKK